MPKFKYKARKGTTELIEGILSAKNKDTATNKLFQQNLFPIEVEPYLSPEEPIRSREKKAVSQSRLDFRLKIMPKRKATSKDLLLFTQNLATLIRAKVQLLSSLKILQDQTNDLFFKGVIGDICDCVGQGQSFSDALGRFPKDFSALFISIVKAGEVSGNLEAALTQLTHFLQMQDNLKRKVLGALIYPAILLAVGASSVFVILNFVIPRLRGVFIDIGVDLPLATKIILKLSEITTKSWMWIGAVLVIFVAAIISSKGSRIFLILFRRILTKLPILKRLIKNQELVNFAKAFSLLIHSGTAVLESLQVATLSIDDSNMRRQLEEVAEKVKGGRRLSESILGSRSLPDLFTKMISVGEESGQLGEVLDEVVNSYTQQIESDIAIITSIIEPVLILILGLILGAIVITILLPIFQVTQMIH